MAISTNLETKPHVVQFRQSTTSILVIDSDPGFCIVLGIMLKLYDYGVQRAHSTSEAIAALRYQKPDLIVCNLEFFSQDEHDLMTYLRSDSADIPIIGVAAETEAVEIATPMHNRINAFIVKPFTASDIQDLIFTQLN